MTEPVKEADENHLIAERRAKLAQLRGQGVAFPNDFRRTHFAGELHAAHDQASAEQLEALAHGGDGGRTHDGQARHGQGQLRDYCRSLRIDTAVPAGGVAG